jgi:signal transduction histidine kinase
MQRATNDLAAAAARTDRIMETVSQGLFLMDPGYRIEGQYSRATDAIFRALDLEGINVLELLGRMLTERMYAITRDYFALLFDPAKKERTVLRVNPLLAVEVNFPNPEGGFISRYLSFAFRRIIAGGVVTQVFVAVDDITTRVELETQIRDSESTKNRQFQFLLGVMHVSPKDLDEFITGAQEQLSIMNTALRTQDFTAASPGQLNIFKQRLSTVFRAVHTLKGSAQTLKLTHFVDLCHEFESKVAALRSKMSLVGDDFLSIVIAQSEITKDIEELADVRVRFLSLRTTQTSGPLERRATDLLTSIANLIESSAESQRKKARLEALGFETARLPDDIRRIVRDVVIQLSRNSITHGVESPEDRLELGKLPVATITIAAKADAPADTFAFTFRDDGRGLDPAAIKESAMKKGLLNAEEAEAMSAAEAIGLIFRPGFSTATEITEDAGRGFGMNIVKEMVVDRLGGKVSIRSEPTRFTEFTIAIPLTAQVVLSDGASRELLPA